MRKVSLLLLLAACGSPTGPSSQPDLEFESGIVFGIPTLPTAAVAGDGMIVVTGVIRTNGSGFTLSADLSLATGNMLTLDIHVTETSTGFGFPAQNFYRARVRSLPPGDYDLSVIHSIHDPSPFHRERVYHQTVRVN